MSDDFPPVELPPERPSSDQFPYGMDTIVIPFTWSKPRRKGPDPMERVGQGYAESRRQLEQALKDTRLTSTELALSPLETLREDFLRFHRHDAGTAAAAKTGTQGQNRVSVPGPGPASSSLFGLYQTAPHQSGGTVPSVPGASWQLDRDTGTLNFFQQDADGSRTLTRSLQVQGGQVLAPNGQALGRVHADGGFELDGDYLAGLGLCPLPGFTADPDTSKPQVESFPADLAGGQPQTESLPAIPPNQQTPDTEVLTPPDTLQNPQIVTMARPKGTPEELEKRRSAIAGKGLPTGGSISYVPPASWTSSRPLPRGKHKGYLDADGNEWVKPRGLIIGEPHWDVQTPDGGHLNVKPDGEISH